MTSPQTIIDVNASLGNWPFRALRNNTPEGMLSLMDANGISKAWVASFDCVLNREPKTANIALAESVTPHRDRLIPFAAVNPSFPTWERDIDFYLDELGMAGVRTYPNYHQYALDDDCFGELLACVRGRAVPLQIAVRVADERMHHPLAKVPAVEIPKFERQLARAGEAKVIFINVRHNEFPSVAQLAQQTPNIFVEISHAETVGGVTGVLERLGQSQVMFGTHSPLLYPVSAILKLREADITDEQTASICSGNARTALP